VGGGEELETELLAVSAEWEKLIFVFRAWSGIALLSCVSRLEQVRGRENNELIPYPKLGRPCIELRSLHLC
jgi:hypothetical protein